MITVAHSPDADDIFMYYAIAFGWIKSKLKQNFKNIALDIETLNQAAIKEEFDVSAISFGSYPFIRQNYALLTTGVSFGNGYGPKLIKLKKKILKRNFKVALSGKYTTNAILFQLAYPEARIIYKNFLDIEKSVLEKEVDAGILIHESILNFSNQLEVECEIWDIWCDLAKQNIPLPLGGMAIHRSIPLNKALDIEQTLIKAVSIAVRNKPLLSRMLLERNLVRINAKELETYLNFYANSESMHLSEQQILALDTLFKIGYDNNIYDAKIECKNYLLPQKYLDLRYS